MTIQRHRLIYLILTILTIPIGLLSRATFIPDWIYPYLGDAIYTVMVYLFFGFVFPRKQPWQLAMYSIACCYAIELSQLYQADWMNQIRSYRLGGLILGHQFLWSDLVSYAVGGITAMFAEQLLFSPGSKAE